MSSKIVRDGIKAKLASIAPTEVLIDLSAAFEDIDDLLAENGLTSGDNWIGLYFLGNTEIPITIGSSDVQGKYRETGIIEVHIVGVAKLGASDSILTRSETIREKLRSARFGTNGAVKVESISPPNFERGATLDFESGYISATFLIEYEHDIDL